MVTPINQNNDKTYGEWDSEGIYLMSLSRAQKHDKNLCHTVSRITKSLLTKHISESIEICMSEIFQVNMSSNEEKIICHFNENVPGN